MSGRVRGPAPLAVLGVAVGLGCAASAPQTGGAKSPAAAPAAAATAPAQPQAEKATGGPRVQAGPFEKLLQREVTTGLAARPVNFADGKLTAEVESSAAPTATRTAESWAISVPIGTDLPISCFVYDKQIDGAATLVRFIRVVKEGAKDITVQQVMPTDAGAVGEDPYMIVTMAYTKPTPAGLLGGQVKMMIRPAVDAPLFCFHDEVGYAQTFKRVTQGLARSLKAKAPTPPPQYVEISVSHLGEVPIGYDKRTIVTDARGVRFDQTISCGLMPRSAQDLNGTDRVVIERSDAKGRVEQIDAVETEGEEIESQFQLTRQGRGREYAVKGKQSGKEVSIRFKSKEKDGLPSNLLVASRLRSALLVGKSKELKVEEFHGGLSPQPLEVIYRHKAPGPDITMVLGKIEASGHLDERGMVDMSSVPVGGMVIREERILVRGTP